MNNTAGNEQITALYCRLSQDDLQTGKTRDESNSITNQKDILMRYAKENRLPNPRFFVDDGISGTTFDRPGFLEMEALIESGKVSTVVVKDLSRFGRNYIEMGNYIEIKYPRLGVRFITVQEHVDTSDGTGLEMMPFHNIFNEWYAAQTSKKVRQVWKEKAEKGERVGTAVPFGYIRDPDDRRRWIIDELAAEVVRKVFALCLDGLGPMQIANRLTKSKVLNPTHYELQNGRKPTSASICKEKDPYRWNARTVGMMLENMAYIGCTVNFKSTVISYKVHAKKNNPREEWQIIPDTHEAIIDRDTFDRVQELRSHRRRLSPTGRKSLFSGLVYCGDCGSIMHFCAAKSLEPKEEFFRCSNYKLNGGNCTLHYIRNVVLEDVVLSVIRAAADYIFQHEAVFVYLYEKQYDIEKAKALKASKNRAEQIRRRISDLDRLIKAAFEQKVLLGDGENSFDRMLADYEKEQRELSDEVDAIESRVAEEERISADLKDFIRAIRSCADITELTPTLVNSLIERIEVFQRVKIDGVKHVPVRVRFRNVGLIDIPDNDQIRQVYELIRSS